MAYDGPRFRRDLISTVFYEGGVRCVDIHDPKRGATFRLFDYEYSVALAFDGRDLGKVISWVRVSTGLELNEEQLTTFAKRLDQLGFLERPGSAGEPPAPLPVPHAPVSAPPRDETTPPPDTGGLTAATRPTPEERLANTATPPEPAVTKAPASEPEVCPPVGPPQDAEPPPAETASPERIAAVPSEDAAPPAEDAAPPSEDAAPPGEDTAPPSEDTAPPAEDAVTPSEDAAPPAEDVAPPAEDAAAPVENAAPPAEVPAPLATETPSPESREIPRHEALVEHAPESAAPPAESAVDEVTATELAPQKEHMGEDAAAAQAAPAPAASSEPDLPVAVGPSPEPPREPTAQRPAQLPTEARSAIPAPRRDATPPPIPKGHHTPTPTPVSQVGRRAWMLYAILGILAALVVGAVLAPFALGTRRSAPVPVWVTIAQPAEVVRWLQVTAPVEPPPLQTLAFPAGGKVLRIASPGLALRPGDVVAATEAARAALDSWARAQEQLAFARQLVEGLRDSGDEKKMASAQAAVTQKTAQAERALAALAKLAITAKEPGTVEQTLVNLGQTVKTGAAALRVRLPGWRARFELNRLPAAQLRKQGLCLAEISGRRVPCRFVSEEGDDTHLVVSLPADAVSSPGLLMHLAHNRIPNAYVLPTAALSETNGKPRVLVAAPHGRVEMRSVVLADRTPNDAVVTQGLDPGDAVIVASEQPVGAGTRVRISEE